MSDPDRSRTDPPIHVVAGVIADVRGRILLARRTEGRDLAGLWEFPGGKVDPGETPEQALVRELREELGIEARVGEAVIEVPQRYPHKRLRLDVRRIASWTGSVKGLDGQALAWVPPHKLASYAMPDADRPVVAALRQPALYLITPDLITPDMITPDLVMPEPGAGGPHHDRRIDRAWRGALRAALDAGARRVQLRAPALAASAPARWRALVEAAVADIRAADGEALINDDVALAEALGIGVHLPARRLRTLATRPLSPAQPVIASCHDLDELRLAQALGCDAAVLGPVLPTASHPGQPGVGWEAFAALREDVALPIYAIGGLQRNDVAIARRHGAQGIAAIRGLWPG